jgi:hypothetical protein
MESSCRHECTLVQPVIQCGKHTPPALNDYPLHARLLARLQPDMSAKKEPAGTVHIVRTCTIPAWL